MCFALAKLHPAASRWGSRWGTEGACAAYGETFLAFLRELGKKLGWWSRVGLDSLTLESKTVSVVGE